MHLNSSVALPCIVFFHSFEITIICLSLNNFPFSKKPHNNPNISLRLSENWKGDLSGKQEKQEQTRHHIAHAKYFALYILRQHCNSTCTVLKNPTSANSEGSIKMALHGRTNSLRGNRRMNGNFSKQIWTRIFLVGTYELWTSFKLQLQLHFFFMSFSFSDKTC